MPSYHHFDFKFLPIWAGSDMARNRGSQHCAATTRRILVVPTRDPPPFPGTGRIVDDHVYLLFGRGCVCCSLAVQLGCARA